MTPQTTNVTAANGDVLKSKQDGLISTAIVQPPAAVDKAQAAALLDALRFDRGLIQVKCIKPGSMTPRMFWYKSPAALLANWSELDQVNREGYNIYIAPGTFKTKSGTKANLAWLWTVHADLDAKDFVANPDDWQDGMPLAASMLDNMPPSLHPSVVVDTGHGFHAYWPLADPLEATPENIACVEAVNRALVSYLGADKASVDASHVLRLPGFQNVKDPAAPYPVVLLGDVSPRRFTLDDFTPITATVTPAAPITTPAAITTTTNGTGRAGDDFNARGDWSTLLTAHGWTLVSQHDQASYWCKPGSLSRDVHARLNWQGDGKLKVYTTKAPPLDPVVYTLFSAYTALEHGGDFHAAAKALAALGYGTAPHTNGTGHAPDLPPLTYSDLDAPPEDYAAEAAAHMAATARPARTDQVLHPAITATNGTGKTTWTVAELAATIFPDPKWAVPGILPVGLCILAGRPKVGKSWLALQIAHAVGTGGRVLDQTVERGRVLFLALEDNPRRLKERTTKQGIPGTADVVFRTDFKLHDGGLADLITEIAGGGYSLVVLDTLTRALGGRADQSDEAAMTPVMSALQKIAFDHDCCVLLIDHHRKTGVGGADVIDSVLGSTTKTGHSDAILGLFKERGKSGAVLKITGRDVEERELALTWDTLTWSWQLVGNVTDLTLTERRQEILAALQQLGTATLTAISNATGQQKGNANHRLQDMVNAGLIWRKTVDKEIVYMLPHTE